MQYTTRRASPVVTFIFGVIFLIGGFFAMKYGQKAMDKAKTSLDWPVVEGVVVKSDVVRKRDSDGDTTYRAEIIYSYIVDSESYESNQRRIGAKASSSNSKGAYKVKNQYPQGSNVSVYYDPESPEDAVLEPGVFLESKILWYVGIGLLVLGVLMVGGMVLKILLVGGFLMAKR